MTISMKIAILPLLIAISTGAIANAGNAIDPMTREYITPVRIVWQKPDSVFSNAEALLVPGDGQVTLGKTGTCKIVNKECSSIILDFGKEIHGGLQIFTGPGSQVSTNLRIRFGESVGEACSETVNQSGGKHGFSTNDHTQRDILTSVSRWGFLELGNTGFRFVRIDVLSPGATINLKEVRAVARYRNLPYVGSFHCSDPRLDSIWNTAAYTVHLNMQEFLWDGIKRDRIIWIGDMHPELHTIMSVFNDKEVVEASLDKITEQFPLPRWVNNMSSYSLWYLIIHHDWYMHHADLGFLKKHKDYITGLVRQIDGFTSEDGSENLNPGSKRSDSRFLDWPSSPNAKGVEAGYRALMSWALQCGEKLCKCLNDNETAAIAHSAAQRLDAHIQAPNGLLQAAALMSLAGTMPAEEAANGYILKKGASGFTTFYGYYMLEALARGGKYSEALGIIRDFWGAMIDLGATSFWEDFNMNWRNNAARIDELTPEGKVDVHGTYGDYCYRGYRHSLCHGWASGPCPWLTRHVLGISIAEPGCRELRIEPHLGDLQFAEGTFPTPYGTVRVRHEKRTDGSISSEIHLPKGVKQVK